MIILREYLYPFILTKTTNTCRQLKILITAGQNTNPNRREESEYSQTSNNLDIFVLLFVLDYFQFNLIQYFFLRNLEK